jgi:hypothetical protein
MGGMCKGWVCLQAQGSAFLTCLCGTTTSSSAGLCSGAAAQCLSAGVRVLLLIQVSEAEGKALADQYRIPFFLTSAKNNINVTESFNSMAGAWLCVTCPPPPSRIRALRVVPLLMVTPRAVLRHPVHKCRCTPLCLLLFFAEDLYRSGLAQSTPAKTRSKDKDKVKPDKPDKPSGSCCTIS